VSHAAVDSEVLFWLVVALMLLLLLFVGAVVWAHPEVTGSPPSPARNLPAPRPRPARLPPASGLPAVVLAGPAAPSRSADNGPGPGGVAGQELAVAWRPQVSGGPPWGPAPKPSRLAEWDAGPRLAGLGQVPGKARVYRAPRPGPGLVPHAEVTVPPAGLTSPGRNRARSAQIGQGRPAKRPGGAHRRGSYHGAHRA
jgi:hypothetical protein